MTLQLFSFTPSCRAHYDSRCYLRLCTCFIIHNTLVHRTHEVILSHNDPRSFPSILSAKIFHVGAHQAPRAHDISLSAKIRWWGLCVNAE